MGVFSAKLMYALADPDDICEDFSDILPSTVTAFAKLFIEQQNMRVNYCDVFVLKIISNKLYFSFQ